MQALNISWRLWIVLVVMALTPVLRGQAGDFDPVSYTHLTLPTKA